MLIKLTNYREDVDQTLLENEYLVIQMSALGRVRSLIKYLERSMGIEPTSRAWEARVITTIRRPLEIKIY